MVAPVQSTVFQFLEMDGSLLSHVLLKFDPIELIHSIGTLRASCKTLKATIESDACALPFLRYLGVNVEKEEWKNAFQKTNAWFPLYQAHLTTPFTILALDYEKSINTAVLLFSLCRLALESKQTTPIELLGII